MKKLKAIIVICTVSLVSLSALTSMAQSITQYDEQVKKHYNAGVEAFNNGDYQSANLSFRRALATNKVLPTNLSYYFAETLYHLGQYKNSKNFADKYTDLTGFRGDFYEEATQLHKLLNNEFVAIENCEFCDRNGYRLQSCQTCSAEGSLISTCNRCLGLGNTVCSKCVGKGVLISVDAFGQKRYAGCDKCDGEGHTVCDLCLGAKTISETCPICFGTKMQVTTTLCDHEDLLTEDHEHKEGEN